jgi:hypothetical protein
MVRPSTGRCCSRTAAREATALATQTAALAMSRSPGTAVEFALAAVEKLRA